MAYNFTKEELIQIATTENSMLRSGTYVIKDWGNSWSFEAQCWLPSPVACDVDGGVYDDDENFDQYNWYEEALHQITKKIDLVGVAVITDDIDNDVLPQILRELGYYLVPCVDFTEDDDQINWIEIFPTKLARDNFYDNSDTEVWLKPMFVDDTELGFDDNIRNFIGNHLHAFFWEEDWGDDGYFTLAKFFAEKNDKPVAYTIQYQITEEFWEKLCREIETNPKDYAIQIESVNNKKFGILFRRAKLEGDKRLDLSLTGREYLETNGEWVLESVDDFNNIEVTKVVGF